MAPNGSVERTVERGSRHATLEAQGRLEPLLETLVEDPFYEFQPLELCVRGGERTRRYYAQFCERFVRPMTGPLCDELEPLAAG